MVAARVEAATKNLLLLYGLQTPSCWQAISIYSPGSGGVFCERVAVRYAFIERHEKVLPITTQCRVLAVSASGYHQHRARSEAPDQPGRIRDMALLLGCGVRLNVRRPDGFQRFKTTLLEIVEQRLRIGSFGRQKVRAPQHYDVVLKKGVALTWRSSSAIYGRGFLEMKKRQPRS